MFILTHFAYAGGRVSRYWPGTHEVDIVGADGYNSGGCREARASHTPFTTGQTPPETPGSLSALAGLARSALMQGRPIAN